MDERDELEELYDLALNPEDVSPDERYPSYALLSSIDQRYHSHELLGRGALKEVYKCYDEHSQRWVALARLRQEHDISHYELFIQEAWLTASLNHPNIIKIHDVGLNAEECPYFTMDLKSNQTLATVCEQGCDLRALLEIFIKVCDAISYAHGQSTLHLDLKPDNIQCDAYGQVLVCDWGLGKLAHHQTGEISLEQRMLGLHNTLYGAIKGTPGFMAPEQVIPDASKDERTDVYALGAILYYLLTGEAPWQGLTVEDSLEATLHREITPPHLLSSARGVSPPASLSAVVLKAMHKVPDLRYASVEALKTEIYHYLGEKATIAERANFFRRSALYVKRHRRAFTTASIILVISASLSTLWLRSHQQLEDQTARTNALDQELSQSQQVNQIVEAALENQNADLDEILFGYVSQGTGLYRYSLEEKGVETTHRLALREILRNHPGDHRASWALYKICLTTMNFEECLLIKRNLSNHHLSKPVKDFFFNHSEVLEQFPNFNFSRSDPPHVSEILALVDFIFLQEYSISRECVLLNTLKYYKHLVDLDVEQIIFRYLDWSKRYGDQYEVTYERGKLALSVWQSHSNLSVGRTPYSWLNAFDVDELVYTLRPRMPIKLSKFNNMEISTLELRGVKRLIISEESMLPNLEKLILPKNSCTEDKVQKFLKSELDLEMTFAE